MRMTALWKRVLGGYGREKLCVAAQYLLLCHANPYVIHGFLRKMSYAASLSLAFQTCKMG